MSAYAPYPGPATQPGPTEPFGQTGVPPAYPMASPYPIAQPYVPGGYPGMIQARPDHPQANTVLVLGIVAFIVTILGPVAWVMGNHAKRECDAGLYTMTDALRAGRILGMVVTILMILGLVGILFSLVALLSFGL